jgi:hypothetical protein
MTESPPPVLSHPTLWSVLFCLLILFAAFVLPANAAPPPQADFFVATNGNDRWSGTLPEPNRQKTNGPFATLARAQQALRGLKKNGPKRVLIRGGFYSLAAPLSLTAEDSGTQQAPVL